VEEYHIVATEDVDDYISTTNIYKTIFHDPVTYKGGGGNQCFTAQAVCMLKYGPWTILSVAGLSKSLLHKAKTPGFVYFYVLVVM
jgi:hypothetical protein